MGTRSVRLDEEAEGALSDIVNRTGLSISDAIKQGLIAYQEKTLSISTTKAADFFEGYDFGEGGYAIAPARDVKKALKDKLRNKMSNR